MPTDLEKICEEATQTLKNEKGQGLVEYALILVLIALVVITAVRTVGTTTNQTFTNVDSALRNAPSN